MKAADILAFYKQNGVEVTFEGNEELELTGFSSLSNYRKGTFSWVRNAETLQRLEDAAANYSCIIGPPEIAGLISCDALILVSIDPKKAFFDVLDAFFGEKEVNVIAPSAVIEDGAVIGSNVSIGANTFISSRCVIGDGTRIEANCTLQGKVLVGSDCYICPGAVLGAEGFAFETKKDRIDHFRHFGGVRLGNNVYVGANCCICRGAIDDTILGNYVKLNSLCHIAHNVVIEDRTILSAGTILMGSVHIGSDCWISTSTVRDQITIGSRVQVGMGSVVTRDVPDDITVLGVPAKPHVKNNYQNDVKNRK